MTECLRTVLTVTEELRHERLSMQELSARAHLSPSHLQRIFRLTTGQSLMDYVRGRKLAHSLRELGDGSLRIIDIAIQYGFHHEQSYIRAFRSEYGCTPNQARREKRILPIRERITPEQLRPVGDGTVYGPELVMMPRLRLVGKPHLFVDFDDHRDAFAPNELAVDFMLHHSGSIEGCLSPAVFYGTGEYKDVSDGMDIEYTPSVEVADGAPVPPGFKETLVPAGLCARFRYVGEHSPLDINMQVAAGIYEAAYFFFRDQSRYVPAFNLFVERVDAARPEEATCVLERICPVVDTLA